MFFRWRRWLAGCCRMFINFTSPQTGCLKKSKIDALKWRALGILYITEYVSWCKHNSSSRFIKNSHVNHLSKKRSNSPTSSSGWWFQPIWKIWVKMGSFPQGSGVKIKTVWNHHPSRVKTLLLPSTSGITPFFPCIFHSVLGKAGAIELHEIHL